MIPEFSVLKTGSGSPETAAKACLLFINGRLPDSWNILVDSDRKLCCSESCH